MVLKYTIFCAFSSLNLFPIPSAYFYKVNKNIYSQIRKNKIQIHVFLNIFNRALKNYVNNIRNTVTEKHENSQKANPVLQNNL